MKKLILLSALLLMPIQAHALGAAAAAIDQIQSWVNYANEQYVKQTTGEPLARTVNGSTRTINVDSTLNYKGHNVNIQKTANIDGAKIGKAVVNFAKKVTPIAMGVAVADLICDLSSICSGTTGLFEYRTAATDYDKVKNLEGWVQNGQFNPGSLESILTGIGCGSTYICPSNIDTHTSNQLVVKVELRNASNNNLQGTQYYNKSPYAAPEAVPDQTRPVTNDDWDNAETALNDPRFDEPLLANGQLVPLANLPIFGATPEPLTLTDTSAVTRDAQGNITGTTRTVTTATFTDGATAAYPGRVVATEATTTTTTDAQGTVTGSTTTTTDAAPAAKELPLEISVEFDNVNDIELPEDEKDIEMQEAESWGNGECPADVDIGAFDLVWKMQPACDFAVGVKPVVLLLAALSGLFIIAGIKVD